MIKGHVNVDERLSKEKMILNKKIDLKFKIVETLFPKFDPDYTENIWSLLYVRVL